MRLLKRKTKVKNMSKNQFLRVLHCVEHRNIQTMKQNNFFCFFSLFEIFYCKKVTNHRHSKISIKYVILIKNKNSLTHAEFGHYGVYSTILG